MRFLAPWLIAFWGTAFGQSSDTVLESRSKIAFPTEIEPSAVGGSRPQVLLGTGLRTKSFLRVKVYAVGLYVDEKAIDSLVSAADQVGDRVVSGCFNKSLRLVTARSIAGESMRDAFEDALSPRFHQARDVRRLGGTEHDFERFQSYFLNDQLAKGTELVFSCSASGRLSIRLGEKRLQDIPSEALCWALFDVYLGRSPISKDAKRGLVSRLHLFGTEKSDSGVKGG